LECVVLKILTSYCDKLSISDLEFVQILLAGANRLEDSWACPVV
jgi:hypothetical protein